MKPIIGITCKSSPKEYNFLPDQYIRAIEVAGGIPVLIPCLESKQAIEQVAQRIDGLLLSGGKDVDPVWYNEEPTKVWAIDPRKDFLELNLTKLIINRGIPILAICRGVQMLNVVAGGTLNQQIKQGIRHYQIAPADYTTHEIEITPDTLLFKIIGKNKVRVNSFHHQSIREVATGFRVSAVAKDGVIEAIENEEETFVLGLQFHVEYLWQATQEFKNIFLSFVKECQKVLDTKNLYSKFSEK